MKISRPSASTAAWVTSSISSRHPQNIMFLERKGFANIFFLVLFFFGCNSFSLLFCLHYTLLHSDP